MANGEDAVRAAYRRHSERECARMRDVEDGRHATQRSPSDGDTWADLAQSIMFLLFPFPALTEDGWGEARHLRTDSLFEEMQRAWARAISLSPEVSGPASNSANMYARVGDYVRAFDRYLEAGGRNEAFPSENPAGQPDMDYALAALAAALAGRPEDARRALGMARANPDPENTEPEPQQTMRQVERLLRD